MALIAAVKDLFLLHNPDWSSNPACGVLEVNNDEKLPQWHWLGTGTPTVGPQYSKVKDRA